MKKLAVKFTLCLGLFLAVSAAMGGNLYATGSLSGFCEQGNEKVNLGGLTSSNTFQQSYPQCTVTVYIYNTVTLATLYSDNLGTPLSNPFTATTNGSWAFFSTNNIYTVTLSGGGISAPFTLGPFTLVDPNASLSGTGTPSYLPIWLTSATLGSSVISQSTTGGITSTYVNSANMYFNPGYGIGLGTLNAITSDSTNDAIQFYVDVGGFRTGTTFLNSLGLDVQLGGITVGFPTGGQPAAGSINVAGQILINNVPVGTGSSYFSRTLDGTYYDLAPSTSIDDRVVVGLPSTDLNIAGVVISGQAVYTVSGSSNASVGALAWDAGTGLIEIASNHTNYGVTVGIGIKTDSNLLAEWYANGGLVGTGATGGNEGIGTANFTGVYVNGVAVTTSATSAGLWTLINSFLYPNSTSEIVINGGTLADAISKTNLAGMITTVKPAGTNGGFAVFNSALTSASYMTISALSNEIILNSGFGSGGALVPITLAMGLTDSITVTTSGNVTILGSLVDLGYSLAVNGTFATAGNVTFGLGATANVTITSGGLAITALNNGISFGTYGALTSDPTGADLLMYTEISGSRTETVAVEASGIDILQGGLVVAGATGGYQGAGTVNAAAYYLNGVALGGGVSGSFTTNTIPIATGASSLGNGPMSVSGSILTLADSLTINNGATANVTVTSGTLAVSQGYVNITNSAYLGASTGYINIQAPSGYSGNPVMNVFFKPDGFDLLGSCGLGNYPCGAAIAVGNAGGTYGNNLALYTDHGTFGSPNRIADITMNQGLVTIPGSIVAGGGVTAIAPEYALNVEATGTTVAQNFYSSTSTLTGFIAGSSSQFDFCSAPSCGAGFATSGVNANVFGTNATFDTPNIYLQYVLGGTTDTYVCVLSGSNNLIVLNASPCVSSDDKTAELQSLHAQIDALTGRLDALTTGTLVFTQAVATKKENQ